VRIKLYSGLILLNLLTIDELLHGQTVDMPPQTQTSITFAKAPKIKKKEGKQLPM
jgi:hypothetical protein